MNFEFIIKKLFILIYLIINSTNTIVNEHLLQIPKFD
jgi:hypothetical protein